MAQGIKDIKVGKKCPKVNPSCDPIFDPIMFLDGAKWPKYLYLSTTKKVKYWVYFHLSVKNHEGLVGELDEIHTMYASCDAPKKKLKKSKQFGQPFIVNFTFEIWK